jgi:hypothetical protein
MAESADAPNTPESEVDVVYPVEKIRSHKLMSKNDTRFLVRWLQCEKKEDSYEPIENLMTAAFHVEQYVDVSRAALKKSMGLGFSGATFTQVPRHILNQCNSPDEYIPRGNETTRKIDMEVQRGSEGTFWFVRFWEDRHVRKLVRRSLMIYYFPMESMMFLKRRNDKLSKVI